MTHCAALPRRALLTLPVAVLPAPRLLRAATRIPPFPEWIGRTALLRADDGAARLLLSRDGGGMLAVSALFLCRPLEVLSWTMEAEGRRVSYQRAAAIRSGTVEGSAEIGPEGDTVIWTEGSTRIATLEGFGPPEAAQTCS
jgi:hypothetical protein